MTYYYNYSINKMGIKRDCNFIKPRQSLNGKTPSEMAGIEIERDNKWLTLMKKSIKHQKAKN